MAGQDVAAERVYQELRRRIVTWELPPGSPLREVALAEELQVSRTPVREALQRLKSDGLVVTRGRRGLEVPRWDSRHLEDSYRLRADLEAWSAKRAAERLSPVDLARLNEMADEMSRIHAAGDCGDAELEAIAELNADFHETIRVGAGSERLHQMTSAVVHLPLLHRVYHVFTPAELASTLAEHHTILRAFEARDPDWAESISRAHILAALHALLRSMREDEDSGAGAAPLGVVS